MWKKFAETCCWSIAGDLRWRLSLGLAGQAKDFLLSKYNGFPLLFPYTNAGSPPPNTGNGTVPSTRQEGSCLVYRVLGKMCGVHLSPLTTCCHLLTSSVCDRCLALPNGRFGPGFLSSGKKPWRVGCRRLTSLHPCFCCLLSSPRNEDCSWNGLH